ncbi:MAG: RNA polymerase sigma factor [Verrucomicrobiales bacterium]
MKKCQEELPHDLTHYREILRRYEGLVYNTCHRMLGTREDAQEVSQDALIQVFHKIKQFEGRSQFKTWLYKIVHNYCRNRISKLARRREGRAAYEEHSEVLIPDTENSAEKEQLSEHVNAALSKLKDSDREIVVLKFMSGLTLQEIAEVTDLGLSATKMRLYRALDAFKDAYQRLEKDQPAPLLD